MASWRFEGFGKKSGFMAPGDVNAPGGGGLRMEETSGFQGGKVAMNVGEGERKGGLYRTRSGRGVAFARKKGRGLRGGERNYGRGGGGGV